jgi:hypothetical protein
MKEKTIRSKGLSHGLKDQHAVSTLVFRLKTTFLEYMHALMNAWVQRRAEEELEPGRTASPRPAGLQLLSFNQTQPLSTSRED